MWLALKIYAGLCTLLVTVYLVLIFWDSSRPQSSPVTNETSVLSSYGEYVVKEYPKRADLFQRLALVLGMYAKGASVPADDMVKYLGKPDLIDGTIEKGTMVYFYTRSGATNKWVAYASVQGGNLTQIGINDATVNNHSGFQPYPTP